MDHFPGQTKYYLKTSLKFRRLKSHQASSGMKLEINNNKRKTEKFTSMWKLKHTLEQPMDQKRYHKGRKNILRDK